MLRIEKAEGLLDKLAEANERSLVAREARHFDRAANRCLFEALVWVIMAGLLGLGLYAISADSIAEIDRVASALVRLKGSDARPQGAWWLTLMLPRLVVLSCLVPLFYWILQNASAALKNRVLNNHRARSLDTMKDFLNPKTDNRLQEQVMLQATLAAFSRPAGIDDASSERHGPTKVDVKTITGRPEARPSESDHGERPATAGPLRARRRCQRVTNGRTSCPHLPPR